MEQSWPPRVLDLLLLTLAEASRIDAQSVGCEAPGIRDLARGTRAPILLDQAPEMSAAAGWAASVAAFLGSQAFRFFNVRVGRRRFGRCDLLRMRKALSRRARLLLLADDDARGDHEQYAFGFAGLGRVPEELVDVGNLAQDRRSELAGSFTGALAGQEEGGAAVGDTQSLVDGDPGNPRLLDVLGEGNRLPLSAAFENWRDHRGDRRQRRDSRIQAA